MNWQSFFRRKSIESLLEEMHGEQRLHRVLGPVTLTSLGIGAIIGAGIFAMTGRVAAEDAGPAIVISFVVAGIACAFAALCYSEFAAMVPVAGSAYTYTYATLGEIMAWIIGWDLILEYAMSCAVVAAHWTSYFNEFLHVSCGLRVPLQWTSDPFTPLIVNGQEITTYMNLPAMIIVALVTVILVIGIRESATTNTVLVLVKVFVVLLVIALGIGAISSDNYVRVPVERRKITDLGDYLERHPDIAKQLPAGAATPYTTGQELLDKHKSVFEGMPERERTELASVRSDVRRWGMLGVLGIQQYLASLDQAWRSPFMPYGFSGIMVGSALVFFAYIGFDSISTHSEEAVSPQRDVPLAILLSLAVCTVLYILVAGVITGMEPYPDIDTGAPIAAAFRKRGDIQQSALLRYSAGLIATGALAGMTSVLLVTFLSQARIFLAMARDGLLPKNIFAVVHPRFRTPHRSTILTGLVIIVSAGLLPIRMLEEMVSIGTLMAFALVCGSVLMLRVTRPDVQRPFRCPLIWFVAPAGILVNVTMMLFLPIDTWIRLAVWLVLGFIIYFSFGIRHSTLGQAEKKALAGTPIA